MAGRGKDSLNGSPGNDRFIWNPGDDTDLVEGGDGSDAVEINGGNGAEQFTVTANGARVRLTRNVGNVILDLDGVERVDCQALGGADILTVNSLSGTDAAEGNINLAATLVGTTGDAQPDAITVNGTASPDTINITANAGVIEGSGLAAHVRILHSAVANDWPTVNGLGGVDIITTGPGVTSLIALTINQD